MCPPQGNRPGPHLPPPLLTGSPAPVQVKGPQLFATLLQMCRGHRGAPVTSASPGPPPHPKLFLPWGGGGEQAAPSPIPSRLWQGLVRNPSFQKTL